MSNKLREQMVAEMKIAGLSASTLATYLRVVETFIHETWFSPTEKKDADLAEYLRY